MSPLRCFFSLCLMSKCLIIKLVILYTSLSVRSSVISVASTYAHPCLPDRRRLCLWCDGSAVNVSIFEQIQLQVVLTASDDQLFKLPSRKRAEGTAHIPGGCHFPQPHLLLPVCKFVICWLVEADNEWVMEWRTSEMSMLNAELKSTNMIVKTLRSWGVARCSPMLYAR